jgi:hypothetical protein
LAQGLLLTGTTDQIADLFWVTGKIVHAIIMR